MLSDTQLYSAAKNISGAMAALFPDASTAPSSLQLDMLSSMQQLSQQMLLVMVPPVLSDKRNTRIWEDFLAAMDATAKLLDR